jgi:hypothetical protein
MGELPSYDLEVKAADDRRRLHQAITELRSRVRQNLDLKKLVRERLATACTFAAVAGLALGYSAAGLFVRH